MNGKRRVILGVLRHGDYHQPAGTPSAHLPYALNGDGLQQSADAVPKIADFAKENGLRIHSSVATSVLLRAWQTGRLIADGFRECQDEEMHVESYEELAERSVGAAANLTIKQIEKIVADDPRYEELPKGWKRMSDFKLPFIGAESLRDAGHRLARFFTATAQELQQSDHDVLKLIVSHGGAIRHAAQTLQILSDDQVHRLSMFHAEPLFWSYSQDGQFTHVGGEWKVRSPSDLKID